MARSKTRSTIDCRVGLIEKVEDFYLEDNHFYLMQINFGEAFGSKKGVVQIDYYYQKGDLIGKKIIALVNVASFPIGPWISEVKILTVCDSLGKRILVVPEKQGIEIGKRLNI